MEELMKERRLRVRSWFFPAAFGLASIAGCHSASAPTAPPSKQYLIHGSVVSVDKATNKIDLNAGTVPGFMEAMTMTYPVTDPAAIGELHPGDIISATLLADEDAAGPKNLRLKDIVITGEANPNIVPVVQYHVPTPGDTVPDFKLLNQSNRTIGLRQFRGKVLVMTFVYTRCPLSDYCPRMSRNFAQIDKALQSNPPTTRLKSSKATAKPTQESSSMRPSTTGTSPLRPPQRSVAWSSTSISV
jgi:protein SCO1/2